MDDDKIKVDELKRDEAINVMEAIDLCRDDLHGAVDNIDKVILQALWCGLSYEAFVCGHEYVKQYEAVLDQCFCNFKTVLGELWDNVDAFEDNSKAVGFIKE